MTQFQSAWSISLMDCVHLWKKHPSCGFRNLQKSGNLYRHFRHRKRWGHLTPHWCKVAGIPFDCVSRHYIKIIINNFRQGNSKSVFSNDSVAQAWKEGVVICFHRVPPSMVTFFSLPWNRVLFLNSVLSGGVSETTLNEEAMIKMGELVDVLLLPIEQKRKLVK